MFEPTYALGAESFEAGLEQYLFAAKVEVIVFNMNPAFSRRLNEGFLSETATRYGNAKLINDDFLVIWADSRPAGQQ